MIDINKTTAKRPRALVFNFVLIAVVVLILQNGYSAKAGERLIINLKDYTQVEVKSGGFTLPSETKIHIRAKGAGGEKSFPFTKNELFAYGWIINADTRELVWKMDRRNTNKENRDRSFDGDITLPKGSYEAYFAAYGYASSSSFGAITINIDRRKGNPGERKSKHHDFFSWFEEFFGDDMEKEWNRRAKEWEIELSVDDSAPNVTMFTTPKEFPRVVFKATKLGEHEYIRQGFTLTKQTAIRIYALGEMDNTGHLADYGWIIDTKTRKRIWQMQPDNLLPAGGASKNQKFDEAVAFPAGEYTLYYVTDDSHSYVDWNSAPPEDPFNYGVTLMVQNENDKANVKLVSQPTEDKNIIVQLIQVGNGESRSSNFSLKEETALHIYALGEAVPSRRQMTDYGWIVNSRTRQRVWTMDVDRTEHAGGADKNRLADEDITLPKGDYTVFYQTDDSHAYNAWNDAPPFDPEHWGITISGQGHNFNINNVERNTTHQAGIIAQIVRVGNSANRSAPFKLDRSTRVRIYALGEGRDREMFDYGWIEETRSHNVVWEMTYSMTFHAGGGRKNRMVNTTLMLDKGEYALHYISDDSHSYNDWNTDPPDDPTMWGITLYEER